MIAGRDTNNKITEDCRLITPCTFSPRPTRLGEPVSQVLNNSHGSLKLLPVSKVQVLGATFNNCSI